MNNIAQDRAMLARYGYIDRREQSKLASEDRLSPLPGVIPAEDSCPGCVALTCPCARQKTATSGQPETLRQARTWDEVRSRYEADGFCCQCAQQAAYGHQMGFSRVSPVCPDCRGIFPSYRFAAEQAHRWAGATPNLPARQQEAA